MVFLNDAGCETSSDVVDCLPITLLPDNVLAEVCSRLTAKSLFRLQLACKDIRSTIMSDYSFLLQSHRRTTADGIFIHTFDGYEFVALDPDTGVPPSSLALLEEAHARIFGSFRGLLFYLEKGYNDFSWQSIWVYNPATQNLWHLPAPPGANLIKNSYYSCIVMTSTSNNDDPMRGKHQLIVVTETPHLSSSELECRVYDSTAKSWTIKARLPFGPRSLFLQCSPAVCRGTVFWASDRISQMTSMNSYVVALDVKEDSSSCCTEIIPVPKGASIVSSDEISMGVWEDKLPCLLHYSFIFSTITLWALLREEKGRSRWEKFYSTNLQVYGLRNLKLLNTGGVSGMQLVFTDRHKLLAYRIKDGKIRELRARKYWALSFSDILGFFPYCNSLRTFEV